MPHENTPSTAHPVTQDMPLPGFYPCLTLQLNVTRYASGGLGRSVLVIREPGLGVEAQRLIVPSDPWPSVAVTVEGQLRQALRNMVWLQEGEKG